METIHYKPIVSLEDELLPAWLDLYETAFPPEERLLVSYILEVLKASAAGKSVPEHILAAIDEANNLLGILFYELRPELRAAGFYYLAVQPELRNGGIGAQIYQEMIGRCREAGCRMVVFDLEIPENSPTPAAAALARRRIAFYHRQGAHRLAGALSSLQLHPSFTPIDLYVMVHALEPITPNEALATARIYLNENIRQVGNLRLD